MLLLFEEFAITLGAQRYVELSPYCFLGIDRTLTVRQKNLFYDHAALRRVESALTKLGLKTCAAGSIDAFYDAFLDCFYAHGKTSKPKPASQRLEPWMTFLSTDELEVHIFYKFPR
jgi:hypothetical protein